MTPRTFGQRIRDALAGLRFACRTQWNLKWHLTAACTALLAAVGLGVSRLELALLIVVIGLVLCAEILNTAVELTIDMIKATEHPVARLVKDVAAGAVLVTVFMALAVAALLFLPGLRGWR